MLKERVRDEIRAELAKHNPIETARGPLELIAETSIHFIGDDGKAGYEVVDAEGKPRTKVKDGASVGLTIQDLMAELRDAHPTLFRPAQAETPKPEVIDAIPVAQTGPSDSHAEGLVRKTAGPAAEADAASASAERSGGPVEKARDWLLLSPSDSSAAPVEPAPTVSIEPASIAPLEPARRREGDSNTLVKGGLALKEVATHLSYASGTFAAKLRSVRDALPQRQTSPTVQVAPSALPRNRVLYGALAGGLGLALLGYLMLGSAAHTPPTSSTARSGTSSASRAPSSQPTVASRTPSSEPTVTGTVPANPQSAPTGSAGPISGVPEVIDTSTLRIDGKVVRLFGVEWARGAQPEDLMRYLRNREIACQPAPAADAYRCQVDGRDLSEVVLYNGGGRAASTATPELVAAESHARSERVGIWRK